MTRALPLDGVLVADFSRVLAGPLLTMTLGDLGADVVKVEPPGGDDTRHWGPPFATGDVATYSLAMNRNKRSVVLDLKDAADLRRARRLADRADVVVSNFKGDRTARYGLGYEQVRMSNPRVVHCAITGFGSGAGAHLPGYDPLVQAVGGLMSVTGPAGGPAFKAGVALIDVIAGLYGAIAVLAALRERERSAEGQAVEVDLLTASLACLANQSSAFLNAGVVPHALGNAHPSVEPFGTYATADGELMVCGGNDRQFEALCRALGPPDLAGDARFRHNADRVRHRRELQRELAARLRARPTAEWSAVLEDAGVPAGPVNDLAGAFALAESLALQPVEVRNGVRTVRFPARLSATPVSMRREPPALDADGDAIRHWLDAEQPVTP